MNQYNHLFTPFKIGNLTIKNRLCVSAMGIRSFESKGNLSHEGIAYYTEFAKGGFGLITTGALAVDNEVDKNSTYDRLLPMAHRRNFIFSCTELTDRVHAYGAKIFAQLSMGVGRNGVFKSASPNPAFFSPDFVAGELTKEEIQRKLELMAESAIRCKEAGFDGIEIHAMHWGYLLDQFAMSLTNRRTDEYGGILENRMRLMKEIVDVIKNACGKEYPVTMRLGLKSYITGSGLGHASLTGENETGRTLEEGIRICKLLESYGYDGLSCDVGVYESFYHACPPMYIPKGAYIPLAEAAKKEVQIPVLLGGRMNDFQQDDKAIAEGKIDAVCLARPALADPNLPKKLFMGTPEKIRPCLACCQCIRSDMSAGGFFGCTVNPSVTRNINYGIKPAIKSKKIIIIGGGAAGMEAALVARQCGHDVTLFEASSQLGGNLLAAGNHPFKEDVRALNLWFQRELKEHDITIHMNTKVTSEMIREMNPEIAILATGSNVFIPPIKGIDHPKSVSCMDVLVGNTPVGNKIAVIGGGMTGVEIALDYAMEGKQVTIIEALDDILSSGPAVPYMQDMMIRDLLKKYNVDVRTNSKIMEINDEGAVIETKNTQSTSSMSHMKNCEKNAVYEKNSNLVNISESAPPTLTIPADTVIMAIGFRPRPSMESELFGTGIEVYTIGDANRVGNIKTAIWDAYETARNLS